MIAGEIVPLLLILICSTGCVTYNLSDNIKIRNFSPVKDEYIVTKKDYAKNQFDIRYFKEPDTNMLVQFVLPEDIHNITESIEEDLLIVFYYPNCSGADSAFKVPKFAEKHDIPYILISGIYSPQRMKALNIKHDLENKNQYIIPTFDNGEKIMLKKRIRFIEELCPGCYSEYLDGLALFSQVKIGDPKNTEVYPKMIDGYIQSESPIEWIKEKYEIEG
ncbi:MAG: hypothetical protein ACQERC_04175 [Bacteroidota bacterium]